MIRGVLLALFIVLAKASQRRRLRRAWVRRYRGDAHRRTYPVVESPAAPSGYLTMTTAYGDRLLVPIFENAHGTAPSTPGTPEPEPWEECGIDAETFERIQGLSRRTSRCVPR